MKRLFKEVSPVRQDPIIRELKDTVAMPINSYLAEGHVGPTALNLSCTALAG